MPNRILREGILASERVNTLDWEAEVFYRRLMSVVDDFGRYSAHPSLLRSALFPLKVDTVRGADIERWLASAEQARLVRVYELDGKRYLEILDFRQQLRAKSSKCPDPPTNAQHVMSTCLADSQQLPTDAHLGGGGVEDAYVDDSPLPDARIGQSADGASFQMFVDWQPSSHISTLARQAGFSLPGSKEFKAARCEFVAFWLTQDKTRTQAEWDHAFVKALKGDRNYSDRKKASASYGGRSIARESFADVDYGKGGRI